MKLSIKSCAIAGITMLSFLAATSSSVLAAVQKGDWTLYNTQKASLFHKKDFNSKTGHVINPQTLIAVEKDGGWYKIKTTIGDKYIWNSSNSIQEMKGVPFAKTLVLQTNTPTYSKPFSTYKTTTQLKPQKIQATEKWGNYYKVKTTAGNTFIYLTNPTIETVVSKPNVSPITKTMGTTKNTSSLYEIPKGGTPVLAVFPKGTKVEILSKNATFAKVSYGNQTGFVYLVNLNVAKENVNDVAGVKGNFAGYIAKTSSLYTNATDASITSTKLNPQGVTITERKGDFLKINTTQGDRWVNLKEAPTSSVSDSIVSEKGNITLTQTTAGQSYPFAGFVKGNVTANTYPYIERSGNWYHIQNSTLDVWVQSDNAPSPIYPTVASDAPYQLVSGGKTTGFFDEALAYQTFNSAADDAYLTKDGEIIAMKKGILRAKGTIQNTINIYDNNGKAFTYIVAGSEVGLKQTAGDKVLVDYHGISGYVNKKDIEFILTAPDNLRNYYEVSKGILYHYTYNPQRYTPSSKTIVGTAPSHLVEGQKYFSNDNRFINGKEMYNYYQYLPLRTSAPYTADDINKFIKNTLTDENGNVRDSVMLGSGQYFVDAATKYNINVGYLVSHAILESGWGTSEIAKTKFNLFGFKAYDVNPGESAEAFKSLQDGIDSCARYISEKYLNGSDWRYFGAFVGEKGRGMNVKYASDPYWGESIASIMYRLDKSTGSKEYKKVTYGVVKAGTTFYSNNGTTPIYTAPVDITAVGVKTVTNSLGTWYEVKSDNTAYNTLYVPANAYRSIAVY